MAITGEELMKVLVISDTHGYIYNARKAIDRNPEVQMILHLGDYCRDALQLSELYPNIKLEYVYGNCDIGVEGICAEKIIDIEGKKIFMTHGHRYSVKWDHSRILEKAEEHNADLILYGHTHISVIDNIRNILIINPGSISESRSDKTESFAVLDISKDGIKTDIFYV